MADLHRAFFIGLLAAALPTAAQSTSDAPNPGGRILGGNTFITPVLSQSAFVSTRVGITEGFSWLGADQLPVGELGRRNLRLGAFQQTLDLSFALAPWFGIYGHGRGSALSGINIDALLLRGASLEGGGDGGVALRVLRHEGAGLQLTLRGFGGANAGRNLTVFNFARALVAEPGRTVASLLEGTLAENILVPTSEWSLGGGGYLAKAFGPAFSLQVSAEFRQIWRTETPFNPGLGESEALTSNASRVDLGAALTVDLKGPLRVPVAVMGEYLLSLGGRTGTTFLNKDILAQSVALSAFYSGRPNLELGLSVVWLIAGEPLVGFEEGGASANSEDSRALGGQLTLRYIW